jgi:molybdenum cofactor synthesis domain-containing protein
MNGAPRVVRSARAVTVGAEILSGKVCDTNSYELARTLRRLGIRLTGIVVVSDDLESIERAVREARQDADVVFTSGGIGPTHDDKTIEGVARALGRPLVPASSLGGDTGHAMWQRSSRFIPEGAELVQLGHPGWPTIVADGVWMLPGIPELFHAKLQALGNYLTGPSPFVTRSLCLNAEELEILTELNDVVARHPDVEIGSYPATGPAPFRTQITFDARSETVLVLAYQDFKARVSHSVVDGPDLG